MQRYNVASGDSCIGIGAEFSVTGSDIISANPTINSECTNLQVGQSLCIPDRSCLQKYKVVDGDVCYEIGSKFGVTSAAIMSANPTIDSMCYYLQIGQIICIPDRSCIQKYPVSSGDTCSSIGAEFGLTGTAISSANPTINSGCTNLQLGQSLCIPDKSCMLKHIVASSNETCNEIGAEFNVTASDIISANPIINSGCTNLQVGLILCIPDGSCALKYTVVSGDTCNLIGAKFGITGSAILTANPAINSECTNLEVGQILCVPGSGRGTIDNWGSCTIHSTCADNWLCCVAPADCATRETTCRPGGTECSSCDGGLWLLRLQVVPLCLLHLARI
jgi:LysM repeat protein